ncbi:MAG: carboxylating nicotinate-nucleotide diphosphorylase [Waddliaceae bacterium]
MANMNLRIGSLMCLEKEIDRLIDISIAEDIKSGDITSEALLPKHAIFSAKFVLKQAGTVAGLPFLKILFEKIDPDIKVAICQEEGSGQKAGAIIAEVTGRARSLLLGERIALNLIQHASGVATITAAYVKKIRGLPCAILDTRKTLPGLRALENYAVRVGGGTNHRSSLDDRFIIKNNHLYFLGSQSSTPIKDAVNLVKAHRPNLAIEVEISRCEHLDAVLETGADAVMLSRMTPQQIQACMRKIRKTDKKAFVESLGTITLDTVRVYAETGVDGISIGSLTHSVLALDIVMRLS